MNYFRGYQPQGDNESPKPVGMRTPFDKYEQPPKVTLNIDPKKLTPDDLLREALRDDPITEMAKLITQRYNVEQSIKKLLPKMTKDEVTEVYHTLYRIAQNVNERES